MWCRCPFCATLVKLSKIWRARVKLPIAAVSFFFHFQSFFFIFSFHPKKILKRLVFWSLKTQPTLNWNMTSRVSDVTHSQRGVKVLQWYGVPLWCAKLNCDRPIFIPLDCRCFGAEAHLGVYNRNKKPTCRLFVDFITNSFFWNFLINQKIYQSGQFFEDNLFSFNRIKQYAKFGGDRFTRSRENRLFQFLAGQCFDNRDETCTFNDAFFELF